MAIYKNFLESEDKSELSKDYKSDHKNTFRFIDISSPNSKKYLDFVGWKNEEIRKKRIVTRDGVIAIDEKGNPAGYVMVFKKDTEWAGNINDVYVDKAYRGQGLGEILVKKAISMGGYYLYVYEDNKVAMELYKKCGFKVTKTGKDSEGERSCTMVYGNRTVNEAAITNDKDIYYNKDKFVSGKINLCCITGHSGSGKSTMGRDMEKDGVEFYELDDVWANKNNFTMDNLKEYGGLIYGFFASVGKKFYLTSDEIQKSGKYPNDGDYERALFPAFIKYAKSYAKRCPKTKFVLDGVWFYMFIEPSELVDCAVYIKGTSAVISNIRAIKRDNAKTSDRFKKMTSVSRWKYYLTEERYVNKYRDYFTKKATTEGSDMTNESSIPFSKMYHVSGNSKLKKLNPRVPKNYMTEKGYEDGTTARVSFCPTIDKCLIAMSDNLKGKTLYIYRPVAGQNIRHKNPTTKEVPDAAVTSEIWVLDPVEIECIGSIIVGEADKPFTYTYGDNKEATLYSWKWTVKESIKEDAEMVNGKLKVTKKAFGRNRARKIKMDKHSAKVEATKAENEPIKSSNVTEACKDLATARKLVQDVQKLGKKYNANFFFVTDGASGYSNGNGEHNPAAKACRSFMDNWEKDNGFNPDDDWSKDPSDTSNYKLHEATKADIPQECPNCGGKVICTFQGEPVYICRDCKKYFGTRNMDGSVTLAEGTSWSTKERYPVYIITMHTGTTFSKIIKFVTGDEFTHVAISFNSELSPMYSFGTRTDEVGGSGFEVRYPTDEIFRSRNVHYNVYVVYVNKAAKKAMQDMVESIKANINKYTYDVVGCIQNFFHKATEYKETAYFCSRFVATLLSKGMELSKAPSLFKPQDVADLEFISLVNSGESLSKYNYHATEKNTKAIRLGNFSINAGLEEGYVPDVYTSYYVSPTSIIPADYSRINRYTCSPTLENALEPYVGDNTDLYVYTNNGPGKARYVGKIHMESDGTYDWTDYNTIIDDIFKEMMSPVIGSGSSSTFIHQCMKKNTFVEDNPDPDEEEEIEYITSRPGMTDIFKITGNVKEKLSQAAFKKQYMVKSTHEYCQPMTGLEYLRLVAVSESGRDFYERLVGNHPYDDISKDTRFKVVPDFFSELAMIQQRIVTDFLFTLESTDRVMDSRIDLLSGQNAPLNKSSLQEAVMDIVKETNTTEYSKPIHLNESASVKANVGGLFEQINGILDSIH